MDTRSWIGEAREKPRLQVLEIRDRDKPEGEPIAWLLVERQETYTHLATDNSIQASIRIHFERILPKYERHTIFDRGVFCGSYSSRLESVSLTSPSINNKGAVFLDLPRLKRQLIGTYLMNEIVTWAQRWPEATVNSIELIRGPSNEVINKERSNWWFYGQFGLEFGEDGFSQPIQVKSLKPVVRWKDNIRELEVLKYLRDLLLAFGELEERDWSIKNLGGELKRAEDKPLRWALQRIWCRLTFHFL